MQKTYDEAIAQVFRDEGGYSNVPGDHGGPTNWGITIADARRYWKADATADDVKAMPKSVAAQIYRDRYATAINYDKLPAGVDYSLLDYAINSGTGRALKVYQTKKTIDEIYDEREAFLRAIAKNPGQGQFLTGWMNRTRRGRVLAKKLEQTYGSAIGTEHGGAGGVIIGGATAAAAYPHLAMYILLGTAVAAVAAYFLIKKFKGQSNGT